MNSILRQDLEIIADRDYSKFNNKTFFITGATGLVGISIIRSLLMINDAKKAGITVVGMVRNLEKARHLLSDYLDRKDLVLYVGDITEEIRYEGSVDYVIHCASVTTSKTMIEKPVDTIRTSLDGTRNILEFAKNRSCQSVIYVSSMEMYGAFDGIHHDVKETDLGYINPLAIRSNYPESKRMCENMCIAYLSQYHVPVKIARLAQTFGAGILPGENRVFAQFARSAIEGKNIVLHTKGKSEGNYVYTRDMVLGLFQILLYGEDGEAYNVSNPNSHMSISDMAHMVSTKIADGRIQVEYDIPKTNTYGYASDTKMKMNSDKLQGLGWKPEIGLEEAYHRLIAFLVEEGN